MRYEWDFGDGSEDATTTIPTVSHAYNESGTYIVSLRVTDDDGDTDVIQKSVTVSEANTVASPSSRADSDSDLDPDR